MQRKITQNPEKEKRFYIGHYNVFNVLQEPLKSEELYLLQLSGQLPMTKVPLLQKRVEDITENTDINSQSSNYEHEIGEVRKELCELVDWEKMSDGNAFDESYGEESNYGSEGASHLDEDETMMLNGVENDIESSDEQRHNAEKAKEREEKVRRESKREKKLSKYKRQRSNSSKKMANMARQDLKQDLEYL